MNGVTTSDGSVTLRLQELVVDCANPPRLARFWAEALHYDVSEDDPEISAIEDRDGHGPSICFQKVSEAKLGKNRVHFDLDVDEYRFADEVTRLLALGATQLDVGQGSDRSWAVLADPEGNEFCVVS